MRKTHREWEQSWERVSHVKYGSYFFSYKWDPAYTSDTSAEPTTALFYSAYYYGFFKLLLLLCYSRYANNPTRPINLLIIFKVVQNHKMEYKKFPLHTRCLKITEKVSFNIWERSELRLHFDWTKVNQKCQNGHFWRVFENLKLVVKKSY